MFSLGCSKCYVSCDCCPGAFWINVFNLTIGHRGQARQQIAQIGVGFGAVASATFDDRVNDRAAH